MTIWFWLFVAIYLWAGVAITPYMYQLHKMFEGCEHWGRWHYFWAVVINMSIWPVFPVAYWYSYAKYRWEVRKVGDQWQDEEL